MRIDCARLGMFDLYGGTLQVLASVAHLLHTQRTIGVIEESHLGHFVIDDGNILRRVLA